MDDRLNRTLATEATYRQVFISNAQRTEVLALWVEHSNSELRHSALGGKPPVSRVLPIWRTGTARGAGSGRHDPKDSNKGSSAFLLLPVPRL